MMVSVGGLYKVEGFPVDLSFFEGVVSGVHRTVWVGWDKGLKWFGMKVRFETFVRVSCIGRMVVRVSRGIPFVAPVVVTVRM